MARSYVPSSKLFVEYIINIIMFGGNKNGNTTIIQVTKNDSNVLCISIDLVRRWHDTLFELVTVCRMSGVFPIECCNSFTTQVHDRCTSHVFRHARYKKHVHHDNTHIFKQASNHHLGDVNSKQHKNGFRSNAKMFRHCPIHKKCIDRYTLLSPCTQIYSTKPNILYLNKSSMK